MSPLRAGALVALGLFAIVWGTLSTESERRINSVAGAIAAPIGVLLAVLGAVLLAVPGFLS